MADDTFAEVLRLFCGHLDDAGVTYAVTGSIASSIHGEPITSQDVDVCLRMTAAQAAKLVSGLPRRFYCSEDAMREAAENHTMANLIDAQTGLKIDLSVLPAGQYYDQVLARRQKVEYGSTGEAFWVVSPEDIILMKLIWRKDTESVKQWENVLSVARTQGARLDWGYLRRWAEPMGVLADLQRMKQESGI